MKASGYLLILACSQRKNQSRACAPAIDLYDGVNYRVLRKFLNAKGWPPGLQIKIISAKYGLIDASTIIEYYDLRLGQNAASAMNARTLTSLKKLGLPISVFINLGKDYLPTVKGIEKIFPKSEITYAEGPIGMKMRVMKRWLEKLPCRTATFSGGPKKQRSYLYFFPDWDDYVYEPFIANETNEIRKSGEVRKVYAHEIFGDKTPYDGFLLSLSHIYVGKGALHRYCNDDGKLVDIRKKLRIPKKILLFGDCGAFSYVSEASPPFSPMEAAEMYNRFGFDIGASVDHIPISEVVDHLPDGTRRKRPLSLSTRYRRIHMTIDNAAKFLQICKKKKYSFVPLGVIQGINVRSYVSCLQDYIDMGYKHIALGGLVPRTDSEILEILCAVRQAIQSRTRGEQENLWLHLFGILRPKLQSSFRTLGVSSFDSASYFRKAWLRSDQNYLTPDGKWYSAIRIPFSNSRSMRESGEIKGISVNKLAMLEQKCLCALTDYENKEVGKRKVLNTVNQYGPLLERRSEDNHFVEKYKELLTDRPWEKCKCTICRDIGINVVVFRGTNRNKRRGLHNTWMFYHRVLHGNTSL